jgi:hypothetical protein
LGHSKRPHNVDLKLAAKLVNGKELQRSTKPDPGVVHYACKARRTNLCGDSGSGSLYRICRRYIEEDRRKSGGTTLPEGLCIRFLADAGKHTVPQTVEM